MSKLRKSAIYSLITTGMLVSVGLGSTASAQDEVFGLGNKTKYKITITNVTYGQVFSPPVVAAHRKGVEAFYPGEPASPGLEILAEDGVPSHFAAELSAMGATVAINGGDTPELIPPGHSATIKLKAGKQKKYLSIVGMLVTTNDAFFGLKMAMPTGHKSVYYAVAYDAGTEVNDEVCDHIPGPPCGNGGQTITPGDNGPDEDGVVHVHRGIHTLSDGVEKIDASRDDWRNPVARIVVERIVGK